MELVILWLGLSILAGVVASNKGRSGFGFFVLALLLSPLVGFIAALVASPKAETRKVIGPSGEVMSVPNTSQCPFCAEDIKREAIVCKHCGRDLPNKEPV